MKTYAFRSWPLKSRPTRTHHASQSVEKCVEVPLLTGDSISEKALNIKAFWNRKSGHSTRFRIRTLQPLGYISVFHWNHTILSHFPAICNHFRQKSTPDFVGLQYILDNWIKRVWGRVVSNKTVREHYWHRVAAVQECDKKNWRYLVFTTRYRLFLSLTECLNLIGGTYDAGT